MLKIRKNLPRKTRLTIFFAIALTIFAIAISVPNLLKQDTIEIAIASPITHPEGKTRYSVGDRGMVDSVQLYLDKINAEGGIQGKKLVLQVYDDESDPDVAVEVAEKIARSSAVAVIGHSSSRNSLAAGKIYQEYGIPAITGSATTDRVTDSQWYFRTIFNNTEQGNFIANYIKYLTTAQKIYLISSEGAYSTTLKNAIEKVFDSSEKIEVIGERKIDTDREDRNITEPIIQDLLRLKEIGQDPDIIIMTLTGFQAKKIIPALKLRDLDYPIIGGDSLSGISLTSGFLDTPQEREKPGFFTNGIRTITPVIFDIADDRGQQFKNEFYQRYGYDPGWYAVLYHDAAAAVVQAIKNGLENNKELSSELFLGKDIKRDRELLRQELSEIDSPDKAVRGITQKFYFDDKGNASAPILMGSFFHQKFISDFVQLFPIENSKFILNLPEKLQSGKIIQIGDRYFHKTNIVYTGIEIDEIDDIDEKQSSYLVDFYLWFHYKGDSEPNDIIFMNYDVERLDSGEVLTLNEPIEIIETKDFNHVTYHMKADFYDKFDFASYPFDRQTLSIRFQHKNLIRNEIIYAIDVVGMYDTRKEKILKHFEENQVMETSKDWQVKNVTFYQSTDIDESAFVQEYSREEDRKRAYSQFNVEVEIARNILSFSLKNLLPLWFFVLVAYSLIFLPFEDISVEAIGGVLLAIVFYHLSLLDALPDGVGYIVALDYAFYLLYFLIGLQLLLVILGHSKRFQATGIHSDRLVLVGRVAFPTIWLVGCLIWYLIYV
ncbi:MAG: ABC transporter substrate-binding protein [Cyanobacteria bacterium SBLK]|nr:ABC transporter substrate-binding protein [Cyanobacteria bacterium SBLK]